MDDWKSILAERLEIPEFKDKEVQKELCKRLGQKKVERTSKLVGRIRCSKRTVTTQTDILSETALNQDRS